VSGPPDDKPPRDGRPKRGPKKSGPGGGPRKKARGESSGRGKPPGRGRPPGRGKPPGKRGAERGKPKGRRPLAQQGGKIYERGDEALSAILAGAFKRAAKEEPDRLTHGFHTWPARMHPSIAAELLEKLGGPGKRVLDPFCGSGTTLVEARRLGARAVGVDLNPLALRVAEVKCWTPDAEKREQFLEQLAEVVSKNEARVKERAQSRAPLPRELTIRWDGHVLRELAGLWEEVNAFEESDIKRALEVLLSSIVVKFSKQRADTSSEEKEKRIGRYVPTRFFKKKGEELVRRWTELEAEVPKDLPSLKLIEGDARQLPELLGGSRVELVVSSPPYGGTYDYHAHHELRFPWLGLDDKAFSRDEMGSRRALSDKEEGIARWDEEVCDLLKSLKGVLRDAGLVILLVGDGEVGGRRVPAEKQLWRLAPKAGFHLAASASEERIDWRGGKPRAEHLVALRPGPPPPPPKKPRPHF
jgi:SAM-dependent methyltransferase